MMKHTLRNQWIKAGLGLMVIAMLAACSSTPAGPTSTSTAQTVMNAAPTVTATAGIANSTDTPAAYPAENSEPTAYPALSNTQAELSTTAFYGTWTINQAVAGSLATQSVTDASGLLGKAVDLSQAQFSLGDASCASPSYQVAQTKLSTFLQTYKAEPKTLSLSDGDAVSISTQCSGSTYVFVQVSTSEVVYVFNGYFFLMGK